jgi:hypothetical protein
MDKQRQIAIKRIQMFMQAKEKRLRTLNGYKKGLYYDKYVKDAINSFIDPVQIWALLQHNTYHFMVQGLSTKMCPFCLEQRVLDKKCLSCNYQKIKGFCYDDESEFQQIYNYTTPTYLHCLLSNNWYKNLIEKIEVKCNENNYKELKK